MDILEQIALVYKKMMNMELCLSLSVLNEGRK